MMAEDLDLGLKTVTITSRRHGERVFHRIRCNEPYTRRDGTVTKLDVWTGSCVVCGEPFEVRTARATNRSNVFATTTCAAHRRLRNGAASEPEDKSLLDPHEVSDLPITTPEVLQAKRKLVIEGMKADRNHFTVRPYPEPAALHIEPRPPVESTVEPAAPLEIVEEAPPSLTRPLIEIVEQPPPESPTTTAQPTAVETEPPAAPSLPPDEDHVSSDWKLRIGITSQLGAYVLRYPSAIEQLRSNGFRAEYFGCDHAFLRDLFDITRLPADQWNRGLAELQRKYPAEHSRYLRLGEHLPALSSEELAEYFIPLAGIIQPNPAPVEIDIEPINSHSILEQEPPAAPPAIVEQQPPEPAVEERAPALQHDFVGHTVTPEHRLIGLIVKHRVPAGDVPLAPEHFHDADLRYLWMRWQRLDGDVDQLDMDAIRARTGHAWSVFTIWLIDVAAAPDPDDNPIDPILEIATLAEQICPAAAPPEIVEEIRPAPPAVEEASPPAPSCSTSSGNGHSDFVGFDVSEPPSPPQSPRLEEQRSVPYVGSARMAEIEAANLAATLALARAGVPVFPARLDWNAEAKKWDKRPAITGWKNAATTDPEIIRRRWRDLPRKLGLPAYRLAPGIWCGHPVLDWLVVDADRHGGPDGVLAFDALVAEPGNELPVGPRTITAGDGIHFVFRQPLGKTKLGNSRGKLPGGVDIRGVDGWIVGPGAMRPDGKMWRGTDGTPSSLIDAFKSKSIPELPNWLACILAAQSERPKEPRKAKPKAEEAKEAKSSGTPPSSDKTATKREKAWARGALNNIVEELGAMPPDSGRNEFTYRKAFAMGTMVVRGWIDRRTVESEMYSACERNGLVADKDDVRGAIERGLNDGSGCPHDDLPDRRTKAARQRRDSTQAWKNLLPTEIYYLQRVRPYGDHASIEAARDVIATIERDGHVIDNLDRHQLGDLLRATFEEFKAIGATFDRHPSRFLPYDATQEEVDAHLAAVRKAKNPARAQAARERRAHEKLKREQQLPPTNELEARRCAAIIRFLEQHPGSQPIGQLVHGLKRAKAFEGLTNRSRRNAILRLVRGKLRECLFVTTGAAKNRKPTLLVELRR